MTIYILILAVGGYATRPEAEKKSYSLAPSGKESVTNDVAARAQTHSNFTKTSNIFDEKELFNDYEFQNKIDNTIRIANGTTLSSRRVPSFVVVVRPGRTCAGNLISEWNVLTAAHCVTERFAEGKHMTRFKTVPLYSTEIRIGSDRIDRGGKIHRVNRIYVHLDFLYRKTIKLVRDIAVVALKKKVELSGTVNVAPVHPRIDEVVLQRISEDDDKCEVVARSSHGSKELWVVNVSLITPLRCKFYLNTSVHGDYHLCTYDENKRKFGNYAGSGLICNDSIVAVASWSLSSDSGYPTVYSRVDNVPEFISQFVSGIAPTKISLFIFLPLQIMRINIL